MTSGVTKDHLARVVVKNRRHGAANPDAMYQKETSVDEVLASRVVCEPLHLFMLCSPNEGAAAVVLRRADLAADHPAPVTLAAAVLRSHIPGSVLSESTPLSGLADDDGARRRPRWPPPRPTRRRASGPPTSTSSSARTPTPPVSCSPARSSASASPAARRRCSTRARRRSAAACRSTRAAACSPRASRSAPRRSARWSSWCASCAASAAPGRSRARARSLSHTVGRGANAGVVILTR